MSPARKLTYAEAIRIVAKDDQRVSKVDSLLGGLIFAAAPFTGGASLSLIDPKAELIKLLRDVTGTAAGRIKGSDGKRHYELLEAAHTVIGVSAFFSALQESVGTAYSALEITDGEKLELATSSQARPNSLDTELNASAFPMPSATMGFVDNLERVSHTYSKLFDVTMAFLDGLAAWERAQTVGAIARPRELRDVVIARATQIYRETYSRFSVDIPEFQFWANTDEHAATRNALRNMTSMLTSTINRPSQTTDVEGKLARRGTKLLQDPIWRAESPGLRFPSVADGFISPKFQIIEVASDDESVHDEGRWSGVKTRQDLASFMATYISDPASTRRVLVVLGHPGAGKTLLSEVVAARLPAEQYTAIVVKLRRVDADAEPFRQIESALEDAARETVSWAALCRESKKTKVVIFDGLDELIQATGVTQSDYVERVARLQELEWVDGNAVIPVVTSRLLVMDRVRLPKGSVVVRLGSFDDDQVTQWAEIWNRSNQANTDFRVIEAQELLHHGDLSRQPLLLFLMAIYAAGEKVERLDEESLSGAELYRRLLNSFITRQIKDKAVDIIGPAEQLRREALMRRDLSIAAFAMFNRGKQFITEEELSDDLRSLSGGDTGATAGFAEPLSRAKSTVAAFFFIHVAQADEGSENSRRRSYEFLHATFGEYLVAEHATTLLKDLAQDHQRNLERFVDKPLNDDTLRALLAHQPLMKTLPIVEFSRRILLDFDRESIARMLEHVFANARSRRTLDGAEGYNPTPFDSLSRTANYTANLATLLLLNRDAGVPVRSIGGDDIWISTVRMWWAGLDSDGLQSLVNGVRLDGDIIKLGPPAPEELQVGAHYSPSPPALESVCRLSGDFSTAAHIRSGLHVSGGVSTEAQAEVSSAISGMVGTRWPTPVLNRMMPFDERHYQSIASYLTVNGDALTARSAEVLLNCMVDDGQYLDPELVMQLTRAALRPLRGLNLHPAITTIVARYPQALADADIKSAFMAGMDAPLKLLLLRRIAHQLPAPLQEAVSSARLEGINVGGIVPGNVAPEMIGEFAGDDATNYVVAAIFRALAEFGELAWSRISPCDVWKFLGNVDLGEPGLRNAIRGYVQHSMANSEADVAALRKIEGLLTPVSSEV